MIRQIDEDDHLFLSLTQYIGCVEVLTSMKVLDFDTRSAIAKECIHRVCEAAGVKAQDPKRRVDRKIAAQLGEKARINELG